MEVLTIGHGNQSADEFIALLRKHDVEVLVDVRSQPFSSRNPQFSQRVLARLLDDRGIRYIALGDKLGGRPKETSLYDADGKPDYELMATSPSYCLGIEQLEELLKGDEVVAVMCSEGDYRECHRHKLVARSLALDGVDVHHVMRDGSLEENPSPQLTLGLEA